MTEKEIQLRILITQAGGISSRLKKVVLEDDLITSHNTGLKKPFVERKLKLEEVNEF